MTVTFRRMRAEDIPDVKRVDLLTFEDLVELRYPDIKTVTARTDDGILSFLRSDPEGAIVAVDDFAGIIGSVFSHIWGRVGWVSSLSVLPSYQGRGVGKELVKRSLEYLDGRGCTDIGLETLPDSQVNLGMYLRIGLRPAGLVLIMGKSLADAGDVEEVVADDVLIERYSESRAKTGLLSQIKKLSDSLHTGLDYGAEVVATDEFLSGETLVAMDGNRLVGLSIVQTHPRREGMQNASVRALAISPAAGAAPLEPLLASSELLALDDRSAEISVPVPSLCSRAVDVLFSRGYSVAQTYERMMWLGTAGVAERTYNLSSWSG